MKIMIFIFLCFALKVHAEGFGNFFPVGKSGASKVYSEKNACEAEEGEICFSISECPLDECKVQTTEVDDLEKPLWEAKSNVIECSTRAECDELRRTEKPFCADSDYSSITAKKDGGGWEAYCTKLIGYKVKTVKQLVPDVIKKEENRAMKELQQLDFDSKAVKRAAIKSALTDCAKAKSLNSSQILACVQAIAKELSYSDLKASDL